MNMVTVLRDDLILMLKCVFETGILWDLTLVGHVGQEVLLSGGK